MVVIGLGKNLLFKSVLAHCEIRTFALWENLRHANMTFSNTQRLSQGQACPWLGKLKSVPAILSYVLSANSVP